MKGGVDERELDPNFPRIYSADRNFKLVTNSIAVAFLLLVFRLLIDLVAFRSRAALPGEILGFVLGIGLALWLFNLSSQRITLYEDAIKVERLFSRRRLQREEIRGYRLGSSFSGPYYTVVPFSSRRRKLKLNPVFRYDKQFFDWISMLQQLQD